jgi:uncharacterized protein YybS (DUF2232 family)
VLEIDRQDATPPAEAQAPSAADTRRPTIDALSLAEGGLLADVAVILELVHIFLPLAGNVFLPLIPVPFVLLMLRRGFKATLLSVLVAGLLIGLITGLHNGWRMMVIGLVGLALGFAMRVRMRPSLVVLAGTAITSIGAYAFFWAAFFVLGIPVADLLKEIQNAFHTANSAGAWLANHLRLASLWQQLLPAILAIEAWIVHYWPLMIYLGLLCWSIVVVMLYYMVSNRLMRFFGFEVRPFPSPRFVRGLRKLMGLFRWVRLRRRIQPETT